jgi:chloramphenicol O-acetyltransferase type A
MGHFLDIESWERKNLYHFYRQFEQPFFQISTEIDVTPLKKFCDRSGASFFLAELYVSTRAINEIQSFRMRLRNDDKVWLHDQVRAGSTVLKEDGSFFFCYFDYYRDMSAFLESAEQTLDRQRREGKFVPDDGRDDIIYYSIAPWIRFSSVQHAMRVPPADSIPRIVFGKLTEDQSTYKLPVSVSAHHALVDGVHVGMYLEEVEKVIRELEY